MEPSLFFREIVLTYMSTKIACTTNYVKYYFNIRMPTSFSVSRRSDIVFSITYAIHKAEKCLQLSNIGGLKIGDMMDFNITI